MENLVKDWLGSALKITQGEMKSLLKFVDSVDGLKKVKDAIESVLCHDKTVANGQIAVWDLMFKELITERMMEIVSGKNIQDFHNFSLSKVPLWKY